MIRIPGLPGKDLCDPSLGTTRRDILRVGASGMLGMSLGGMLELQAGQAQLHGGPGWGKAKSIIMVYLQGGPSHLDLWDPKENVPDNVRSVFKPISTKIPGGQCERQVHHGPLHELYPQRAFQSYRCHLPNDDRLHYGQG